MSGKKIAVAGATGRVGRHVVEALEAEGHEVVSISRSQGVDVITGEGLAEALEGVDIIVDTATGPSPEEEAATEFFTTAAQNFHSYGERAGVERLVLVSIIGADRFAGGYGAAKVAHERATLEGPIPAIILRAAQFHEFVEELVDWGRQDDGSSQVPRARMQLVAAQAVGEKLAELATRPAAPAPDEPIHELAGPCEETLVEAARLLAGLRGDPERVDEVREPDERTREVYESGGLLPGPDAVLAGPTYEAWLETAYSSANAR
jgi:uncharacterized protein YbjT (DUF2867 family)